MINITNLHKNFGDLEVLKNISTEIKKGEIFSEQNICVKRPGDGINPMRWDDVIGQISQKDYKQDDLI